MQYSIFAAIALLCHFHALGGAPTGGAPMGGAPTSKRGNLTVILQEINSHLHDLDFCAHGQKVEIDILQEKITSLEKEITQVQEVAKAGGTSSQKLASSQMGSLETRLSELEKEQVGITSDLKLLKQHIEKNGIALSACQTKLGDFEKHLSADITSLKKSIQSMVSLLQEEEEGVETYSVKPGDSLGKIALKHKIPVETLKKTNQLTTDTIFVGQKLRLPNP